MLTTDQETRPLLEAGRTQRRTLIRLGLLNGLLIGLALALGAWGPQVIFLFPVPVRNLFPPLILGCATLALLGALAGGLSAWLGSSLAGALAWTGTAVLMALVIAHVPYDGYNLTAWLADRRFWGLPILPFNEFAQVRLWLSGFFIVLLLAILGLFQDYRLEGLTGEVDSQGRLSARGWFSLLLPLLLVLAAGLIADSIVNSPLRSGPRLVHEVIQTGRTYSGDLFQLSLETGVNYTSIASVREQMSPHYTLSVGEADLGASETVFVVADFDNGTLVYCRVVAGSVSHCYDASPPYFQGLPDLLINGEFPADCPACRFRVSDELRAWLVARGGNFGSTLRLSRPAQWGSYALVRVQSSSGNYGIECRFQGISPVRLEDCWEVEGSLAVEGAAPQARSEPEVADEIDTPAPSVTPLVLATPTEVTNPPLPEDPLALYSPAMRPDFAGDLASTGPLSRYRIEVTIDPERATVSGKETVHYVNTAAVPQETVYLRLYPNALGYGGEMSVRNVQVEGEAVATNLEVEGTALRVPLPVALPPRGEVTITLDFETAVPLDAGEGYGQFIYEQDVMALANFFPIIPAYDEENCARFGNCDAGWNIEYPVPYGDAVFSPSALFEVFVSAPTGWSVVASGSTIEQIATGDTLTWHIVSGPVRDFNVVLSPRFEVSTQTVEDIVVNSYYLPEDAAGGRRVLRWVVESLAFFNTEFGPYPFAEFDAAATPTIAGGIEYPGLIAMPIWNYGDTSGRFQWSTVHEVVHQWWYSLVGNDQQDEPWLDEALTQYSTALYYEFVVGWGDAVEEVFESRYQQVAGTPEDELISLPVAGYTDSNYGAVVYGKGPLFFDALRQQVGDRTFVAILQEYFNTYRYDIASGPDLLHLAERVSGQDLSALYQEWLGDWD
jgi:hypothetical protein